MVERFTESQIDEFKECFNLFDGDSDGKQKVRFPEFLKMLAEQTGKMIGTEKEILAAFTALDREKTGSVSHSQLQHLMTGTGDKLGTEEFDHMLRDLGLEGCDRIQYTDLVRAITH
ncbi:uncharacterized protein [Acropora muricata]|uniref:uncharacterized protein isoform X3 n=1 Tax=Acropora muricata TaxID=159855 RepID=UPI0034E4FE93